MPAREMAAGAEADAASMPARGGHAGGGAVTGQAAAAGRRFPSPLLIRVLSAAVLVFLILGALASGFLASAVVLGALILVGVVEFYLITRRLGAPAAPWVLFPLTFVLLFRFQLGTVSQAIVPFGVTL